MEVLKGIGITFLTILLITMLGYLVIPPFRTLIDENVFKINQTEEKEDDTKVPDGSANITYNIKDNTFIVG